MDYEYIFGTRKSESLQPIYHDHAGALAADLSFPGLNVLHLVEPDPRPSEDDLIAAVACLAGAEPDRIPLLFLWDATESEPRLRAFLVEFGIKVILARTRIG